MAPVKSREKPVLTAPSGLCTGVSIDRKRSVPRSKTLGQHLFITEQISFNKTIEIAVKNRIGITYFKSGTMVLDHAIGM